VRLRRDPDFEAESDRFALRFCCEDCGFFDASAERCRHDWPTEHHRLSAPDREQVIFCKEFELC
jgi:hypothetical protein